MAILITPIITSYFLPKTSTFSKFLLINLYSLPLIFLFLNLLSSWPHIYVDFRLEELGYNQLGMAESERLENVDPAFHEEATGLYWSNMGLGWPLQAILIFVFILPYPSVMMLLILIKRKVLKTP